MKTPRISIDTLATPPTVNPKSVAVIGWFWTIIGGTLVFWGGLGVFFMIMLLRETQGDPEYASEVPIMLTVLGILAVLLLLAVVSLTSGLALLKLRPWSRRVLEGVTWFSLALMACLCFWWVWAVVHDERPTSVIEKAFGMIVGIAIVCGLMAPLCFVLRSLRGEVIRNLMHGTRGT